jgi:hypothetical protein
LTSSPPALGGGSREAGDLRVAGPPFDPVLTPVNFEGHPMPAILAIVGFIACVAALGVGIVGAMLGSIVAVVSPPTDRILGYHPVVAGVTSALIGLLVFTTAAVLLARAVV